MASDYTHDQQETAKELFFYATGSNAAIENLIQSASPDDDAQMQSIAEQAVSSYRRDYATRDWIVEDQTVQLLKERIKAYLIQ